MGWFLERAKPDENLRLYYQRLTVVEEITTFHDLPTQTTLQHWVDEPEIHSTFAE